MKYLLQIRNLSVLILATIATNPVFAQPSAVLEEVVVTAQKREQSLDDIGITIDAFTGEAMRQNGVNSLIDLSNYSPGLNIRGPFGDFGYPIITLRGVNTDGFVETLPQSTGVYTDGVYISQPPMLTVRMFDLERVEVLKGPQGTIYGRNTIAGAVNFIAKRPTFEPEDYFDAGDGRYDRIHIEAAYGGPLSDTVAGRAAFKYLRQFDGPLTNTNPGVDGGGEINQFSGRVSLLFTPNEDVELLIQVHGVQDKSDVWPFSIIPGGKDVTGNGIPDQLCNDFFVGGDPSFDSGGRRDFTKLDTETYAVFGQIEYPLTDSLKGTIGARYSWIDREFSYSTNSSSSIFSVTPAKVGFNEGDWSGRVGLDWQVSEDVLLYGSISRGFNAGTYNSHFINNAASLEPTSSENLVAYEVGIKGKFYDGKLSLTAAGFYYDCNDMQVVAVVPTGTIDSNRLTNAEGATLAGFELQVRALPTEWLDINLGISYIDSEFDTLRSPAQATGTGSPFPFNGTGVILELEGKSFPNAPEWSLNSTTRATFPINAKWNLIAQADISWEDDIKRDLIATQALFTRSHWNVDGRITLQSTNDTWCVSLYPLV